MAKRRKKKNQQPRGAKNVSAGVKPEEIAAAVSGAVSEALEPIGEKLDGLLSQQQEKAVQVDDATLELIGVETPEELGDLLEEAAGAAADQLDEDGESVAAAVIDAGLDTAEVVDALVKSRKSRKAKGEELEPATVEEVAEIIEAVAEEVAGDLNADDVQDLVEDGFLADEAVKEEDPEETPPAAGAKQRGKKSRSSGYGRKSERGDTQRANRPDIQRKYQHIYTSRKESQITPARELKAEDKIVRFARAVKCADYFARGGVGGGFADPERAASAAERFYKDATLAREFKSMSVTQPSSAGVLVPQDRLDDVIPMLYDQTVVFELGAQRISMPHGNTRIPRQTQGARAHFGGEGRNIKVSQPDFDELILIAKRLQAIVISTEELLRSTDYSTELVFGRDLLEQMRLGIDWGALMGNGTLYQPLGLFVNKNVETLNLLTVNDTQIADAQGRPTSDLPIFVKGKILAKNVIGNTFGWSFNSEAEQYFKRMKSTDGKYIWKDEMDTGKFNGDPYRTTNQIKTDETTGTTSLVFGLWSDMMVGEQFGLETRTTYDATVQTDLGDVNTFQSVQTATRATTYIDIGNRHNESFIKVKNMKVRG